MILSKNIWKNTPISLIHHCILLCHHESAPLCHPERFPVILNAVKDLISIKSCLQTDRFGQGIFLTDKNIEDRRSRSFLAQAMTLFRSLRSACAEAIQSRHQCHSEVHNKKFLYIFTKTFNFYKVFAKIGIKLLKIIFF